ncbi:SMP-30/gluconolactonase/LRE family protein [candidate division KSB1 bacterium]|nr:SMP-30/gluconolactonase/LRE family protein [candidate division KSB1 bacterium]MBL7094746.1 SMP-30/gluconolactonase/LRE family protein [candidate division KSB1 bacterium]
MSISLSKKVNYDSKGKTRGSTDFYQLSRSSLDGNLIIHRSGQQIGEYTQLGRDFSSNIRLRDFIFAEDTFLVVDSEANQVWKYNVNGAKKGKFKLNFKDGLNSPEGIALDSDGNIYIADWGNHRVVVFDDTGGFKYSFGKFGKNDNNNQNKGVKARFVFPTRITVEEDVIGVTETVDNIPIEVFKEKHILVADRYGVHKFDSQGHYLHSPVRAGGDFPEGSFYAIAINGYGVDSNLYVAKRRDGEIIKFSGKAVKK